MSLKQSLFNVQLAVSKVYKDGNNPHHKSHYPTLESVLDALNQHLTENKLLVIQRTALAEGSWALVTEISHIEDNEVISFATPLLGLTEASNKMQALGSAITYSRRYALMSFFKLAPTDDDAEMVTSEPPKLNFVKKPDATPSALPQNNMPETKRHKIADGVYKGKFIDEVPEHELRDYINKIAKALVTQNKAEPKWFSDLREAVHSELK